MKKILTILLLLPLITKAQQVETPKVGTIESKDKPTQIRISCTNRASQNPPLCIVNGYVVEPKLLADVNPNFIQSIEVFKNANAIIQFGEQAKNGVISITVKEQAVKELIDKGVIKPVL